MRRHFAPLSALFVVGLAFSAAPVAAGPTGYVLGNGGTTLYSFDVAAPGVVQSVGLSFSGGPASLQDIDFRPLTGQLYGYDDVRNAYYTINVNTGTLTVASGPNVAPTGSDKLGIDFNPMIDRLRTVTELDQNIVFNPNDGTTTVATNLFYGSGDPNFGVNPQVVSNAYTNNVLGGSAASTTQYVLDANLNTLAILANNAGTLTTVGAIRLNGTVLDFGPDAGFDIFAGPGGMNTAYALLNVGGRASLYTINLTSAEATLVGDFSANLGTIRGLAVTPIPEPSSIMLAGIATAAVVAIRLRRPAIKLG